AVWYHPPDYRYGNIKTSGLLQFLGDENGTLHYRSFSSASREGFGFEKAGVINPVEPESYPIWQGMNFQLQVTEYLPRAVARPRSVPVNQRPGLEREDLPAAIRCRLTTANESREFWVGKSDSGLTPVAVGGEEFQVGYNVKFQPLDFELRLVRAEQPVDPGTQQAAGYTRFVQLTDKKRNIDGADYEITMTQPLDYRGYKFYQSGYLLLGSDPDTLKPISRSILTVGRDPGLWLKYAGSTMLALGITCMFYMKAYFFKPRGRKPVEPLPTSNGELAYEK